eukprot:c5747_g1_i2.p1 GENE.c5747_g1_i2~~c5747_g1_i2.p1  ORF type:complete len:566 (+),score=108.13 c5747_g1_i2:45-1700(+)
MSARGAYALNLKEIQKPAQKGGAPEKTPKNEVPQTSSRVVREPVGVVKPKNLRETPNPSQEPQHSGDTPRLVQSRKGTILEIFGSQKNIDIEAHCKPKSGWLSMYQKLSWNKKYFVVLEGFLLYFPKAEYDLSRPEGLLHLANCDVVDCGTSKRFSFAVNCPNGDGLTLLGENPSDVWEWMAAIYLASKVSTRACLTSEMARESIEEHGRRLQLLAQQLVRTMDVELKAVHAQVRSLKQDTVHALDKMKVENENRLSQLADSFNNLKATRLTDSKPAETPAPFINQVVTIAMRSLEAQVSSLRDELTLLKNNTNHSLRRIKEEYESQLFDLATKFASVKGRESGAMSHRGSLATPRGDSNFANSTSAEGEQSAGQTGNMARAVMELRELAEILQPVIKATESSSDVDTHLSAAVRTKLVPIIADLPTISNLVKQLEDERNEQIRQRERYEAQLGSLKEKLELVQLKSSTVAAEGQQAYEMLTHIEEQLYTDQTKSGEVFQFSDPTHVKVYKVMNAFEKAMKLVAEVEEQLYTLTNRSKQAITTRRWDDDEE